MRGNGQWHVYSIFDGICKLVGSFEEWHSILYLGDSGELYNLQGSSGWETITQIIMEDGLWLRKLFLKNNFMEMAFGVFLEKV